MSESPQPSVSSSPTESPERPNTLKRKLERLAVASDPTTTTINTMEVEEQPLPALVPATRSGLTTTTPAVVIKSWDAVAVWSYDLHNETCAICHNVLEIPCIECEADPTQTADQCLPASGQCNHAYHRHCITKWLTTRSTCPMDNEEWAFQ